MIKAPFLRLGVAIFFGVAALSFGGDHHAPKKKERRQPSPRRSSAPATPSRGLGVLDEAQVAEAQEQEKKDEDALLSEEMAQALLTLSRSTGSGEIRPMGEQSGHSTESTVPFNPQVIRLQQ